MTPEQKLMAFMQVQTPTRPDPAFEYAVMERLARRRAVERFTRIAMMFAVAGGLLLALVWGLVHGQLTAVWPVLAATGALAISGLVVWSLRQVG